MAVEVEGACTIVREGSLSDTTLAHCGVPAGSVVQLLSMPWRDGDEEDEGKESAPVPGPVPVLLLGGMEGGGEGEGDGKPNDWEAKTDSQTGHTYYYSAARGRSSWTAHTHTGATTGSQEEIQTLDGGLRMLFESLCDAATGMDNKTFVDFAENSKLTGKRLGRTEVDLIFSAVKLRNKRTLDFGRFQEGVRQMATKKGVTYQELLTHVGFHAPKREEVVQATKIARWLVVTGNKEDAGQRRLMGEYKLVEGASVASYG